MAELLEIERIAREVVNANTVPGTIVSIGAKDGVGWDGDPLIRLSVVITPEAQSNLLSGASVNILTGLSDALIAAGEDRFPMIDYTTTTELAEEDADTGP